MAWKRLPAACYALCFTLPLLMACAPLPAPNIVHAKLIAAGLATPLQVTHATPTDPRLFIVTKAGQITLVTNDIVQTRPFLDISAWVSQGFEQGLLGIAFDPQYANNGVFYVNYTGRLPDGSGNLADTRIVAFRVDSLRPDRADLASATALLSIPQPESNHNGGQLAFGPDGYLYIATGDGGGGGDRHGQQGNAQDGQSLLGKMLRYQTNGLAPLTIPNANPFVNRADTNNAIWALGLRNPFRFSFDRITGDLYIADVGQDQWEEINLQPANSSGGENYGWRLKEGLNCFNPTSDCDAGNLTDPIHVYAHGNGRCSVTGGFVYRGTQMLKMQGRYLFADYCSGEFWTLAKQTDTSWDRHPLQILVNGEPLSERVTGFGEDHVGALYITTSTNVYKLLRVEN